MPNDFEAHIRAAEERLRQAMLQSDVNALDALIAPDLLFTNHIGQRITKAQDLATHQSGIFRLSALTPSEQHIQLHADFAVVSVLMHLQGHYDGTPIDLHLRYTRVWWQTAEGALNIVAGHASAVA